MKRKAIFTFIIVVVTSFMLFACGNEDSTQATDLHLPPVSAESGMLSISTVPADAAIYINGFFKGYSPAERGQSLVIQLGQGNYTVEAVIRTDGPTEYYAQHRNIFVSDLTIESINLELTQRTSEEFRAKYGGNAIEPQLVTIPSGSFKIGSSDNEPQRVSNEGPQHLVQVQAFRLAKYAVTFDEWDACVADGGCTHWPDDSGWGRGQNPVINISYQDIADEYIPWLNRKTGKNYRLPSEAEWEYAARAGSTTRFHTGDCITTSQANFNGSSPAYDCPRGEYRRRTLRVGNFHPNSFGLHDMHGNVWEMTQDCWNDSHYGVSSSGLARADGDCEKRVIRGGSWFNSGSSSRSASRHSTPVSYRNNVNGFRLAESR